jgi:hypothetical protein
LNEKYYITDIYIQFPNIIHIFKEEKIVSKLKNFSNQNTSTMLKTSPSTLRILNNSGGGEAVVSK